MIARLVASRIVSQCQHRVDLLPYQLVSSCLCRQIHATSAQYKGHSKWDNIKHIKAAKDRLKAIASTAALKEVATAIKHGNGIVDPKLNRQLAAAFEKGKKNGVTMESMMRQVKRLTCKEGGNEPAVFGYIGPSGSSFLIVVDSSRPNYVNTAIRSVIKKTGLKPQEKKAQALRNFEQKGIVEVIRSEGAAVDIKDEDAALEVAIEVGAEEVEETEDSDGVELLQFLCDIPSLNQVKQALQDAGFHLASADIGFHPVRKANLSEQECQLMMDIFTRIYENDEVVKIYNNIE